MLPQNALFLRFWHVIIFFSEPYHVFGQFSLEELCHAIISISGYILGA